MSVRPELSWIAQLDHFPDVDEMYDMTDAGAYDRFERRVHAIDGMLPLSRDEAMLIAHRLKGDMGGMQYALIDAVVTTDGVSCREIIDIPSRAHDYSLDDLKASALKQITQ